MFFRCSRAILSAPFVGLVAATSAIAAPRPGFPGSLAAAPGPASPVLADIDGDGKLDIIVAAGNTLNIFGGNGRPLPGFPIEVLGELVKKKGISVSPVVVDLDGDGAREIVVATPDDQLLAIGQGGKPIAGSPIKIGVGNIAFFAADDLDGDKLPELVGLTATGRLYVWSRTGERRSGFPVQVGQGPPSGIALGDVDHDGKPDIVATSRDGSVYVWSIDGRPLALPAMKTGFQISIPPVIADVNDDGLFDIVVGSHDFRVHAWSKGVPIEGFPAKTGYRIYAPIAIADVTGDGIAEVVVVSADRKIHAFAKDGQEPAPFPIDIGGVVESAPVVQDLDGDGVPEIALITKDGVMHVVDAKGVKKPGFPTPVAGQPTTGPVIGDLDGDTTQSLVMVDGEGKVRAWSFGGKRDPRAAGNWAQPGHDSGHSGRYFPNAPRFVDLKVSPAAPRVTDAIEARATFRDPDGRKEEGTVIRWTKDGAHQKVLDNQRTLLAGVAKKGERWRFSVQSGVDFAVHRDGPKARLFLSPEIEIANTPPGPPTVSLAPDNPTAGTPLEVKILTPSADPDGDAIRYAYQWFKDRKPMAFPPDTARIDTEHLRKNELWSVIVTPSDGTEKGIAVHAEIATKNRPPGLPIIAFENASPKTADGLKAKIVGEATDPDLDRLTYRYRWSRNGEPQSLPLTQASIPPFLVRKGDKWKLQVNAFDGETEGEPALAEASIVNTAPRAPVIALEPKSPTSSDDLRARIVAEGVDDDGDPLTYRFVWKRNGADVAAGTVPSVIVAKDLKRGETWSVEVVPNDTESDGAVAHASVTIENSAPKSPVIQLKPWVPLATDPIQVEVLQPATDIDGDKVTLKVRWERNGQTVHEGDNELSLPAGRAKKGEKWRIVVSPHDGTIAGPPVELFFSVANSPPLAPKVAITPEKPKVTDFLSATIVEPGADADNDSVSYRYRWFRNGELQPERDAKLAPGRAKRGERWRVEVTPFDGTITGERATADVVIVNTAPSLPVLRVVPDPSRVATDLECRIETPPVDADGDPLRLEVTWFRDGKAQNYARDRFKLGRERGIHGAEWACEVRVSDAADTVIVRATGKQANTPPTSPAIEVVPKTPRRTDALSCEIRRESRDDDQNRVRYRTVWSVDGVPAVGLPENATHVPADPERLRAGQVWRCTVTPNDGRDDGKPVWAEVQIQNSPPTAPRSRIVPMVAKAGDTLTCDVTKPATDVDRDPIQYRFYWQRNGSPQNFATTSHQVPARLVKYRDTWQCFVSAFDGKEEGPRGGSEPIQIER